MPHHRQSSRSGYKQGGPNIVSMFYEALFFFFVTNTGGTTGVVLGLVFGVWAAAAGPAAGRDFFFGITAVLGIPAYMFALGGIGAAIGLAASFTAKRGRPITAWSKKAVNRGKFLLELGEIDKAFALADKVIRIGVPDFPDALKLRGDVYLEKGDVDKAVDEYTKVIRRTPDGSAGYYDRCGAYLIRGDYSRAFADCNEAIRLHPNAPGGYLYRGKAYSLKGDTRNAVADYGEMIRAYSGLPYAYYCRGALYKESGDFDKAIADFTEAIRLRPLYGFHFGCRGDAYLDKGDFDRAAADFSEAIRFGPDRATWHFFRGVAYENMGDIDSAVADYKLAAGLEPGGEEAAAALDAVKKLCDGGLNLENNPTPTKGRRYIRKKDPREDLKKFLKSVREYRNEGRIW